MRVSVVIIARDEEKYLAAAVDSVLGQTYRDFDVVLVDDASTDGTGDLMKTFTDVDRVFAVFTNHNQCGPAVSRNLGIGSSYGELIVPLDGDDMLASTFLEKTVAAMDAHVTAHVVFTDTDLFGDAEGIWRSGPWSLPMMRERNRIPVTALFKRVVWERSQYAPEEGMYSDWGFWLSAAENGFNAVRVPEALWRYRRHADQWTAEAREGERAVLRSIIARRHPGVAA
ncbi:MAG: glycosyltransferase family 2 protein [Planctomycetota bacterium]|jgi:glycosyltransferase involved in cell wall biosynthesis